MHNKRDQEKYFFEVTARFIFNQLTLFSSLAFKMEDEEMSSPEPDYRPLIPSASSSRLSTSCVNNSFTRGNEDQLRSANMSQSTHADSAAPMIAVSCESSLSLSSVSNGLK